MYPGGQFLDRQLCVFLEFTQDTDIGLIRFIAIFHFSDTLILQNIIIA